MSTMKLSRLGPMVGIVALAFLPTVASLLTNLVGQYGVGLASQVIIQLLVPVVLTVLVNKTSVWQAIVLPLKPSSGRVRWTEYTGILLAVVAVVIILGSYAIFRPLLDIDAIRTSLMLRNGVTAATYPLVTLSVALINPFLEEYFWRGFIYRSLAAAAPTHRWRQAGLWLAGAMFALHHMLIFGGWFVWWQWILVTLFLALVGVMFNWLYEKSGSILVGLMVHTAADITLAILGLSIFGIIHL